VSEFASYRYPFKPGSSFTPRYTESDYSYDDDVGPRFTFGVKKDDKIRDPEYKDMEDLVDIIKSNPREIAWMLKELGYDAYDIIDEVYNFKRNPQEDDIPF
jgi:hypothetical protein